MKLIHITENERFGETDENKVADQLVARVLVNLRNFERQNKESGSQLNQSEILNNVIDALRMIADGHKK